MIRQDIDNSFTCQECGKRVKAPCYCLTCKRCDQHCDCEPVFSLRQCPLCDGSVVRSEVCPNCNACPRCCAAMCGLPQAANGDCHGP